MAVSQKPWLLMDDSELQLSAYPLRQANPFLSERSFTSASFFPIILPLIHRGRMLESAGVEVEAKLVHSLQGKVEHPTPAFCPGPAGDLCWFFFFISARFWGATTSSTMNCLSRFTFLGRSGFELESFQVLPAQALCSSRPSGCRSW